MTEEIKSAALANRASSAKAEPKSNDGKEQEEFELWATGQRYNMETHPMHWLFLDQRTYAARQGWKAALDYVARTTSIASPAATPASDMPATKADLYRKVLAMPDGPEVIGPAFTPASDTRTAVPDGWKLVPLEPTEDMVVSGFESQPDRFFSKPDEWTSYQAMTGCQQAAHRARLCWAAMLAAAPTAAIAEADAKRDCQHKRKITSVFGAMTNTGWKCKDCGLVFNPATQQAQNSAKGSGV